MLALSARSSPPAPGSPGAASARWRRCRGTPAACRGPRAPGSGSRGGSRRRRAVGQPLRHPSVPPRIRCSHQSTLNLYLAVVDPDRVASSTGTIAGQAGRAPGRDVEAGAVTRALDLAAVKLALVERPAVVGADVVDAVQTAVDVAEGQPLAPAWTTRTWPGARSSSRPALTQLAMRPPLAARRRGRSRGPACAERSARRWSRIASTGIFRRISSKNASTTSRRASSPGTPRLSM